MTDNAWEELRAIYSVGKADSHFQKRCSTVMTALSFGMYSPCLSTSAFSKCGSCQCYCALMLISDVGCCNLLQFCFVSCVLFGEHDGACNLNFTGRLLHTMCCCERYSKAGAETADATRDVQVWCIILLPADFTTGSVQQNRLVILFTVATSLNREQYTALQSRTHQQCPAIGLTGSRINCKSIHVHTEHDTCDKISPNYGSAPPSSMMSISFAVNTLA